MPWRVSKDVSNSNGWDFPLISHRFFHKTKPPEQGDAIYGSIGFRCAYPPE